MSYGYLQREGSAPWAAQLVDAFHNLYGVKPQCMRPEVTFRKIGLAGRLKPAFERRRGTYGSNSSASGSGRGVPPEDRNCPQSPRRKLQPLAQTPLALSASTAPLSAAMKVARVTEHPEADRTPQRCSQCTAYSTLGSISLCVPVARAQGPARAGRGGASSATHTHAHAP